NDNEPNAMTQSESSTEQVDQPSKEAEDPDYIDTANILSYRRRPRTNLTQIKENKTPKSYNEALSGPNKERWEVAIQTKLDNMENLKVWTPCPKSGNDKPITCTGPSRLKKTPQGSLPNTRLVSALKVFDKFQGSTTNTPFLQPVDSVLSEL
ncbi:hypothetical protein O181_109662, partial [Austropuccinia psidii MF-1]|nr:hypothetical protein [Austropuccinia psidii MF-1]